MRIVQANAVYDPVAKTPAALLALYPTLTGWSAAVARAGADVSVVQRFHTAATVAEDGIHYQFVTDSEKPWLSTTGAPDSFIDAIVSDHPDVIHVNGLIFPQLIRTLRQRASARTAIVAQHHGGEFPIRGSGMIGHRLRTRWKSGLAGATALSFTAAEQAEPWRAAGVLTHQRVIEIVEASTTMREVRRERAVTAVGVSGNPLILWVGRLTTNKDPISVLDGLERALPRLPDARVVMVFGDNTLIDNVDKRVRSSAVLASKVTLAGKVSHDEIPNYYAAADVFVSGSHHEGSGYALIEAMSAGLVPVVTDIPSFRAIVGNDRERWIPGDPADLARVLLETCSTDLEAQRVATRARFNRELTWYAIGARTVSEYRALLGR